MDEQIYVCYVVIVFGKKNAGLAKAAKEEHARDLPLMNGIKEVIKSVGVLDSGSPDYQEALYSLFTRLKSLLVCSAPSNDNSICHALNLDVLNSI